MWSSASTGLGFGGCAGGPIDDDSEQEMKAWPGDDEMDVLRLVGLLQ